jgi:hypothetical protein
VNAGLEFVRQRGRIDFDLLDAPDAFAIGRTEIVTTPCVACQP